MFVPRSPRVPCPARQWGLCRCFGITSGSSVPPVPHPLLADLQLPSTQSSVPSGGSAWSHTQSSSHRFQILNVTNFRDDLVLLAACNNHSEVTKGISVSRAQAYKKMSKNTEMASQLQHWSSGCQSLMLELVSRSWVPKCFSQIPSHCSDWILHTRFQGE